MLRSARKVSLAVPLLLALVGCGGGGGGGGHATRTAGAKFSIAWGTRSRAIEGPSSALSATVALTGASSAEGTHVTTANRKASLAGYTGEYATGEPLSVGPYVLTVRFFAGVDATGDMVAQGTANVTITSEGTGIGTVALGRAVSTVEVVPSQIVPRGTDVQLLFAARDACGTLLALSPGSASWSIIPSAGAMSLAEDGVARGGETGPVDVQVEVDHVTSPVASVTVSHAPVASISVDLYQFVPVGTTKALTLTARDASGTSIFLAQDSLVWTVVQGGTVLSVSPAGLAMALQAGTARVQVATGGVTSAPQAILVPDPNPAGNVPANPPYFVSLVGSAENGNVFDLSADGSIAVGYSQYGDAFTPVVWKDPSTFGDPLPSVVQPSQAYLAAISADGRVALGVASASFQGGIPTLFGLDGSRTALPLPAGKSSGYAVDLNVDGTVMLCTDAPQTSPFNPKPYVVRAGTATYLPLPANTARVRVGAISGDGSTVVGAIDGRAVRWVDGGSPEFIADGPSGASGVSRDGRVIVGTKGEAPLVNTRPFRWTPESGAQPLQIGASYALNAGAVDVSDDGRTVLITGDEGGGAQGVAQLWREGQGTKTVTDLFAEAGGEGASFNGANPRALSGDGRTIIGHGLRFGPGSASAGEWKLKLP